MQAETVIHDLDDFARGGSGRRGLEHGFVEAGVELLAQFGTDDRDAMLGEDVRQFAQVDTESSGCSGSWTVMTSHFEYRIKYNFSRFSS